MTPVVMALEGGVDLSTIVSNVSTLTTALTSMFTALSTYWFMWLPITMTVFTFILGAFKSIMFFRKRRRH